MKVFAISRQTPLRPTHRKKQNKKPSKKQHKNQNCVFVCLLALPAKQTSPNHKLSLWLVLGLVLRWIGIGFGFWVWSVVVFLCVFCLCGLSRVAWAIGWLVWQRGRLLPGCMGKSLVAGETLGHGDGCALTPQGKLKLSKPACLQCVPKPPKVLTCIETPGHAQSARPSRPRSSSPLVGMCLSCTPSCCAFCAVALPCVLFDVSVQSKFFPPRRVQLPRSLMEVRAMHFLSFL